MGIIVSRPGKNIVEPDISEATMGLRKPLIIEKGPNDNILSRFQLNVEAILKPLVHKAFCVITIRLDSPLLPEENNMTASLLE